MKIIFLYGGAASGKLTVARELAKLTGFAVFHNHLIVDAVASVFPFGDNSFIRLRERFWLDMFGEAAKSGRSLIFTFAPEATVASDFPRRAGSVIEEHGGEIVFVRLILPTDEQERRIGAQSRGEFGKLRSLELLRQLRGQFAACEAAMPPAALTIDTALIEPAAAAQTIVAKLALTTKPPAI
jgi:hypothetical protein